MFKPNPIELNENGMRIGVQMSFFSAISSLSPRYQRDIQNSWATTFRLIMAHINEAPYAVLYSNTISRSNTPVNRMITACLLKEYKGFRDDDTLRESCNGDIAFRWALCCEDLPMSEAPISDNTLTNFRGKCIRHYIKTGVDLIHNTFDEITKFMAETMEIDKSKLSIDSTNVESWAKRLNRLELLYLIVECMVEEIAGCKIHKKMPKTTTIKSEVEIVGDQISFNETTDDSALKVEAIEKEHDDALEAAKEILPEVLHPYLDSKNKNVTTYHSDAPYSSRLQAVVNDAKTLIDYCDEHPQYKDCNAYQYLLRVFTEQCKEEEDGTGTYVPKTKDDNMDSNIMQSPYDPEATHRIKNGQSQIGYQTVFTQARNADKESLVLDYIVEKNNVSDQVLGERMMERVEAVDPESDAVVVGDSLFNSDKMTEIAANKGYKIQNTNLTGKKPADHCADHEFDENGMLTMCAGGVEPVSAKMSKNGDCIAKFEKDKCAKCPYRDACNYDEQKKYNSLRTSTKTKERAQAIRNRGSQEFSNLSNFRNGVETVPSQLKNVYKTNNIRRPGLADKTIYMGFKYLALNVAKFEKFLSRRRTPCALIWAI